MQNSVFLALLMLIFALKTKIAPHSNLGVRVDLRSLKFGQKIALNFGENLFFFGGGAENRCEFWRKPFFFEIT